MEKELEILELKETKELETDAVSTLDKIKEIQIIDNESNKNATDLLKLIKSKAKAIQDYWKDTTERAYKIYKDLKAKEKEMLEPLQNAENIIKSKMSDFIIQEQRKAQEEQEKIRKQQEIEALKQIEEAEKLRKEGKEIEAITKEQLAYTIDTLQTKVETNVDKVEGVNYMIDYDIEILDPTKIPSYLNGIEIRKIDTGAIKKLVKMANGKLNLEGIKVIEKKIIRVRS